MYMQSNLCSTLRSSTLFLQVHYKDQVKFESIKTEGQFLHCSGKTFGEVGFHVLKNKSVLHVYGVMDLISVARTVYIVHILFSFSQQL